MPLCLDVITELALSWRGYASCWDVCCLIDLIKLCCDFWYTDLDLKAVMKRGARGWEEAGVPTVLPGCTRHAGEHVLFHSCDWQSGKEQEYCVQIRLHLSHEADVCLNIPLDCIITKRSMEPSGCSLYCCWG